jgi:16S rRNA (guanine966-N2)-methyltransferase
VREAVFSALASLGAVSDARVLDLFAGSGALGIEALSRGAASAVFVDNHRDAVAAIRANLAATGLGGGSVVQSEALRYVQRHSLDGTAAFDLAFVDPPYDFEAWPALMADLATDVAVLESNREIDLPEGWRLSKIKRYGGTVVTIARKA